MKCFPIDINDEWGGMSKEREAKAVYNLSDKYNSVDKRCNIDNKTIQGLLLSGLTMGQVAEKLGISSYNAVNKRVLRHGMKVVNGGAGKFNKYAKRKKKS